MMQVIAYEQVIVHNVPIFDFNRSGFHAKDCVVDAHYFRCGLRPIYADVDVVEHKYRKSAEEPTIHAWAERSGVWDDVVVQVKILAFHLHPADRALFSLLCCDLFDLVQIHRPTVTQE